MSRISLFTLPFLPSLLLIVSLLFVSGTQAHVVIVKHEDDDDDKNLTPEELKRRRIILIVVASVVELAGASWHSSPTSFTRGARSKLAPASRPLPAPTTLSPRLPARMPHHRSGRLDMGRPRRYTCLPTRPRTPTRRMATSLTRRSMSS